MFISREKLEEIENRLHSVENNYTDLKYACLVFVEGGEKMRATDAIDLILEHLDLKIKKTPPAITLVKDKK
jgi:hypothetical protein